MKKTNTVLILVLVVAVNLSNGHSIKAPGTVSTSFSGSSSSASAFAHSSSSSYIFNGPIDPNQLESLKAGAIAGATAGAVADAGAGAGSPTAHRAAGATANAGAGAQAGSISGAFAGSGSVAGTSSEHLGGSNAGSGAISGSNSGTGGDGSGCSGGSSGCEENQDSNTISSSTAPVDTGSYKIINTNKYNTGYSSDSQGTNYAVAGQYVQGSQTAGGCKSCNGPFPGPNGSIHDYKLASSVPSKTHSSGGAGIAGASVGSASSYQPHKPVLNSPGTANSIYVNKPSIDILPPAPSGTVYHGTANHGTASQSSGSGHISPGLIATFPGPSGSIYDSKPAGAGAVAVAGAGASAGSYYGDSGSVSSIPTPVGCKYTPGSPNKNCGGSVAGTISGSSAGGHSTIVLPILPGPSGSIHDSKPAFGAGAVAGSGASADTGSYSGSGSVGNIPSTHPVIGPACTYTPGSSNKNCAGTAPSFTPGNSAAGVIPILPGPSGSIYQSKPANSVPAHGHASGAAAGASAGSYSDSGSVSNIPSSHPVFEPACSNNPGSPKYCGGTVSTTEHKATPGSSASIAPILPGPSGSIYTSKPASSVPSHTGAGSAVYSGSAAGASAGSYSDSGSVSNIPSSHPVVGPVCSNNPGSPNYCGTPGSSASARPSGSIHTSKPASSVPSQTGAGTAVYSGSGTGAGLVTGSGTYTGSGSVSNIPSTHPIVGPSCSYSPGSPNTCGSQNGVVSGAGATAGAAHAGCPTCKGPFPGPHGSIHNYILASSLESGAGFHYGSGAHVVIFSPSFGSQLPLVPSIHPELPASLGTYYVNKPTSPSNDIEAPGPSFSGQIPCTDSSCGSEDSHQATGSSSGAYAGFHSGQAGSSQNSNVVFVNKDTSGLYGSINHDDAHKSGGIVFDNGDGSYHNVPTSKPTATYKNSAQGGYAVSEDDSEDSGVLVGPGTGNLPIESDEQPFGTQGAFGGSAAFIKGAAQKDNKPFGTQGAFGGSAAFEKGAQGSGHSTIESDFGTQGAFGGSAAFIKGAAQKDNKPFGTQGAFGGSAAFATSGAAAGVKSSGSQGGFKGAPSSGNHFDTSPCALGDCSSSSSGNEKGFASGDVTIQKAEGTLIASVDGGSYKPGCSSGACNSGLGFGSDISSGSAYANNQATLNNKETSPVKLECSGASCGDTEVYIINDKSSNSGSYGSNSGTGCLTGSCGGSGTGSGSGSGFATGQVLVQKGNGASYDITNQGTSGNTIGGSYSGSNEGSYSGNQFGSSGCSTGLCSGAGFGGSYGFANSGGILNKLFGSGGLSGTINKFAGNGIGNSGAYSNAGSYASAGAGSFASASASAQAGSFAHSF